MLGGVVSVSEFLHDYLRQWAPSGLSMVPSDNSSETLESSDESSCSPAPPSLIVVPLSAWNCFGSPPFPDFGALVASRIAGPNVEGIAGQDGGGGPEGGALGERRAFSSISDHPTVSILPAARPEKTKRTVGVMKLSPEKGCSIVLELARTLPHLDFLAVAGGSRRFRC